MLGNLVRSRRILARDLARDLEKSRLEISCLTWSNLGAISNLRKALRRDRAQPLVKVWAPVTWMWAQANLQWIQIQMQCDWGANCRIVCPLSLSHIFWVGGPSQISLLRFPAISPILQFTPTTSASSHHNPNDACSSNLPFPLHNINRCLHLHLRTHIETSPWTLPDMPITWASCRRHWSNLLHRRFIIAYIVTSIRS